MHPAALPGSAGEHRVDGGDRAAVRIGDDQLHPGKAAVAQAAEEAGPEHLVLAVTDVAAEHLAAPVGGHAGGDHHRPGDHPATYPGLAVGGIEEHVRDRLFVQRAAAPGGDLGVEAGADPAYFALADARLHAEGGD